jgi:hypothetical protein
MLTVRVKAAVKVGNGAFKAYEKGEWGRDVDGAWGFISFPHPLAERCSSSHRRGNNKK